MSVCGQHIAYRGEKQHLHTGIRGDFVVCPLQLLRINGRPVGIRGHMDGHLPADFHPDPPAEDVHSIVKGRKGRHQPGGTHAPQRTARFRQQHRFSHSRRSHGSSHTGSTASCHHHIRFQPHRQLFLVYHTGNSSFMLSWFLDILYHIFGYIARFRRMFSCEFFPQICRIP